MKKYNMKCNNAMKTRIILFAAIAALCASCAKDAEPVSAVPETVELKIDVCEPGTKALVAANDTSDKKFNNVQVFVYNSAQELERSSGVKTTRSGISLSLVPGTKTVWAIVNAPEEITAPSKLADFQVFRSHLSDNSPSSLVMGGTQVINLVTNSNLTVNVKHYASKIVIDKISRKFTDTHYSEIPMTINRIYMSNVAADCDILCMTYPTEWLCKMGELASPPACADLLVDSGIDASLPENGSYNTSHTFYVYPNPITVDKNGGEWGARKTRLILECTYNGKTCYYPVTIPGSSAGVSTLQRNKVYKITELTLKRPGSTEKDSKDPEVSSDSDFSFNIQVSDWETGATYTEQF